MIAFIMLILGFAVGLTIGLTAGALFGIKWMGERAVEEGVGELKIGPSGKKIFRFKKP